MLIHNLMLFKTIIHHPINPDDDFDYLFGRYNGSKILVMHWHLSSYLKNVKKIKKVV